MSNLIRSARSSLPPILFDALALCLLTIEQGNDPLACDEKLTQVDKFFAIRWAVGEPEAVLGDSGRRPNKSILQKVDAVHGLDSVCRG